MLRRFYSQLKLNNDYAIMTVALLQRNPIVMRPLSEIEKEYAKYRQNLEAERARGTFNIGTSSKGNSGGGSAISVAAAELDVTEAIELNEEAHPKDLNRKLHRKLYLCLKDGGKWTLPMSRFSETDSALHSHVQTLLSEILAPSEGLNLYHLGTAPVAFHFDKFGDRVAPPLGAKHFFFRSQLVAGKIRVLPKYEEYGWFSKEELKDILTNEVYESIEPLLMTALSGLQSLELSRSVKENHGSKILKIATSLFDSQFSNLVAVLSATQVNIYDTDNLGQGHMDIISHYSIEESEEKFVDCCWLANENDGYLAILLESGDIELLSLSYSAVISHINLPISIKISRIFADPTDGERLFGIDANSDTLHIFSFDASADSPLVDSQALEHSSIQDSSGQLLEITSDRLKMRPLISDDEIGDGPLLEISGGGRIEFASARRPSNNSGELDYFIIDHSGRIFSLNNELTPKISSSVWGKRALVAHDGDNLLLILCKDGNLALFDLDKNDFSVFKGALKTSSIAADAFCTFISPAECCSQGLVKRVLIGDDTGLLNIYRIVQ